MDESEQRPVRDAGETRAAPFDDAASSPAGSSCPRRTSCGSPAWLPARSRILRGGGRLDSTPRLVNGSAAKRRLCRGRAGQVRRYTSGTTSGARVHLGSSEPLRFELHVGIVQPGLSRANATVPILQLLASTELYLRETRERVASGSVQFMRAASSRHLWPLRSRRRRKRR